jgi:hypothetical protein
MTMTAPAGEVFGSWIQAWNEPLPSVALSVM